jgi:hypothetical protein
LTSEPELDVLGERVARWYVLMLDAGMKKCEKDGRPLTDDQRFTLLTPANWR